MTSVETPSLPTAKLTAIARLKSATGSIMDTIASRKKTPAITFPPPSWNIEELTPPPIAPSPEIEPSPAALHEESANDTDPTVSANAAPEHVVEPLTFAMKLRAMIESLSIPGGVMGPKDDKATAGEGTAEPPLSSPVPLDIDPELVKMLSSEDVMNGREGQDSKDASRPSVWSVLSGLRRDKDAQGASGKPSATCIEDEEGGLMMYAPLEPKADSQVCLAESEVVPFPSTTSLSDDKNTDNKTARGPTPEIEPTRIWVPSTTEISVLTLWWGYRLYLPPPVMAKLGATSVKAAARAAMITSALKWMLDKIPVSIIPPQFRPVVTLLKRLTPMSGYVGVFIAWSWDRIKALDEGSGVVLTATWLLPVALLPMAWDAGTIYHPILLPDPEEIRKFEEARRAEEEKEKNKGTEPEKDKKKSRFRFW